MQSTFLDHAYLSKTVTQFEGALGALKQLLFSHRDEFPSEIALRLAPELIHLLDSCNICIHDDGRLTLNQQGISLTNYLGKLADEKKRAKKANAARRQSLDVTPVQQERRRAKSRSRERPQKQKQQQSRPGSKSARRTGRQRTTPNKQASNRQPGRRGAPIEVTSSPSNYVAPRYGTPVQRIMSEPPLNISKDKEEDMYEELESSGYDAGSPPLSVIEGGSVGGLSSSLEPGMVLAMSFYGKTLYWELQASNSDDINEEVLTALSNETGPNGWVDTVDADESDIMFLGDRGDANLVDGLRLQFGASWAEASEEH
jgi:hypothetical protein